LRIDMASLICAVSISASARSAIVRAEERGRIYSLARHTDLRAVRVGVAAIED
jgi:hypothetical protein